MTLEELLEQQQVSAQDIESFIEQTGFKQIKKRDLDKIAMHFGDPVMKIPIFEKIYEYKQRESNKKVALWVVLGALVIGLIGFWRFIIQYQ